MKHWQLLSALALVCLMLVLIGCNSAPAPAPGSATATLPAGPSGLSTPVRAQDTPTRVLPDATPSLILQPTTASPASGTITTTRAPSAPSPTSNPAKGLVTGVLVNADSKKPVAQMRVLLAQIKPNGGMASDVDTSPQATSNDTGAFTVRDIAPGKYQVLVVLITESQGRQSFKFGFVVDDAGKNLQVDVKAGQTTDIGTKRAQVPAPPTPARP